ncbi:transposase family protein [Rhizobium mulingense]|nr:transposase family protein [Rhizobium sp. MJ31]
MLIAVRPASRASPWPICRTRSERIHSGYQRRWPDLPLLGKSVRLVIKRDGSTATQCCAAGKSSPSASTGTFSRLQRGELPGSTTSSIISGLQWVAGQRPPLPTG